jgi:hypothetical protein
MPIGGRFHIWPEGLHGTCQKVSFLFKFFRFSRQGCTERVGTYVYGATFPHLTGRVARNVWESIIL